MPDTLVRELVFSNGYRGGWGFFNRLLVGAMQFPSSVLAEMARAQISNNPAMETEWRSAYRGQEMPSEILESIAETLKAHSWARVLEFRNSVMDKNKESMQDRIEKINKNGYADDYFLPSQSGGLVGMMDDLRQWSTDNPDSFAGWITANKENPESSTLVVHGMGFLARSMPKRAAELISGLDTELAQSAIKTAINHIGNSRGQTYSDFISRLKPELLTKIQAHK